MFNIRKIMWFVLLPLLFSSCEIKKIDTDPVIQLKYEEDYTPTYDEVIDYYKKLEDYSYHAKLTKEGDTDVGKPLHLFILSGDGDFDPKSNREKGKTILMINNGIHPGESCGIDGSLLFADELLRNVDHLKEILKTTTIVIIPIYNTGGMLNRSAYNRANQVGPTETGFRGNARNLDLNRDFIKCDSKNARSFNEIYTKWNPDVFLDTHTTNGSDHQYCITLIPTCPSALPEPMEDFLRKSMLPSLYQRMQETPYEMTPYVAWSNHNPGEGITMTLESARFSTGYSRTNLSYGFMTENHVYKTFQQRVESIHLFIRNLALFTAEHSDEILESRKEAVASAREAKTYNLDYAVDTTQYEWLNFKGYESGMMTSPVTGLKRFGYDRTKPFEKKIKYFTTYRPTLSVEKPNYYILPAAWDEAVDRMKKNDVKMEKFPEDVRMLVDAYYLTKVSNPPAPYNGHFFHDTVEVELKPVEVQIYKDDYLIPLDQDKVDYIIECLEPKASDSFFRWNFFDDVLDRREYFSPWGFEENAQKYLDEHPGFEKEWEQACANNPDLINNHYEQMKYIYSHSSWAEKSYRRYPVYRLSHVKLSWAEEDD